MTLERMQSQAVNDRWLHFKSFLGSDSRVLAQVCPPQTGTEEPLCAHSRAPSPIFFLFKLDLISQFSLACFLILGCICLFSMSECFFPALHHACHRGQKGAPDPLELEVWMVMDYCVGAHTWPQSSASTQALLTTIPISPAPAVLFLI